MGVMTRREVFRGFLAAGCGGALTGTAAVSQNAPAVPSQEQAGFVPRAFRGAHQPVPLPFDPARLSGLSEKLIRSHWENNYSGAVRALNEVEKRLDALRKDRQLPPYVYGSLKREELMRTGSVVLHEHYFANLGGNGRADGKAKELLQQWFGSYEQWESEFRMTAGALSGGSGWVILAANPSRGEVHNYWASDHTQNAAAAVPLLVLDMYEHAYHMDYGAAAAKYIDAFFANIQWEEVNRRVERVLEGLRRTSG